MDTSSDSPNPARHNSVPPQTPSLCLLELRFTALSRIGKLPLFHGPQWSALIRERIKPHLSAATPLANTSIRVHPVDTGVTCYEKGDPIAVGLTLPAVRRPSVAAMLTEFNRYAGGQGHFQPGKTVRLQEIRCRILKQPITADDISTLTTGLLDREILDREINALASLDHFTISFCAPLRLKRPAGHKISGHTYCDPDFFLDNSDPCLPVRHLLARLAGASTDIAGVQTELQVQGGRLLFLDSPSGQYDTPYGGTRGNLMLTGKPTPEEALSFVVGQYLGLGQKRAHGLGFYVIPELTTAAMVSPLLRPVSILDRSLRLQRLESSLEKLHSAAPGPDGVTVQDIKAAGQPALTHIRTRVMHGEYKQGEMYFHKFKKDSSSFRTIAVQNSGDKLLQRALADYLYPVIETLLSDCAWAYRKKRNRQGAARAAKQARANGFDLAFQSDITSFFDSIDHEILLSFLEALFHNDPITAHFKRWFQELSDLDISGLPQGSPLSPLLSNLYLEPFDRAMHNDACRYVRYGDDFVILFKNESQREGVVEKVEQELARLDLSLNEEKNKHITSKQPVEFLGYQITAQVIKPLKKPPKQSNEKDQPWLPVFRENWHTGTPVYISSICRGAFSRGSDLIVDYENEQRKIIPWNRISHIIVVGRSSFSGGVVYRAVREDLPVSFIDVMGIARGHLYPARYQRPKLAAAQDACFTDEEWSLSTSQSIIQAQILNRYVLLKRNKIEEPGLKQIALSATNADSLEQLRGYEGSAARMYYVKFATLLEPFAFSTRVYHPPDNEINTMLSFGYTLLYNRIATALWEKGFDPVHGFFHQSRGRHFALASDMMEDLRHIVERVVLSLIHKKEITPEYFKRVTVHGQQGYRLEGDGFRKFIHRYEHTLTIPFSYKGNTKMTANGYFDEAASSLARSVKLSIPYEPLRIR